MNFRGDRSNFRSVAAHRQSAILVSAACLLLNFIFVSSAPLRAANKTTFTESKSKSDSSSDDFVQLIHGEEGKVVFRGVNKAHRDVLTKRISGHEPIAEFLSVYIGKPSKDSQPMLGVFKIQQDTIVFVSRFGLSRTSSYTVRIRLPEMGNQASVSNDYYFPGTSKPAVRETVVTAIFPSANILPDNLLKFYIYFSKPMSRGEVYEHIELIDADTNVKVEQPFLEIQQELWTADQTRFTLLFDPGRIKRGLRPREEIGPPLRPGKKYILRIKESWKDAENQLLVESHEKQFKIIDSDRLQPKVENWKLTIPKAGSLEPLQIDFDESLDHAMLSHTITLSSGKDEVAVSINILEHEKGVTFTPETNWVAGTYRISIDNRLEDVSGNSVGRAFEVDAKDSQQKTNIGHSTIPFSIPFSIPR